MPTTIEPVHLAVPESELTDLRERLERVRWPDPETVDDTAQGPRLATVRALCDNWLHDYDWRRCEELLNGLGQHRTTIDGLGVHFLHVRSPEPDALPLLLTHGWPGSVLEFRDVIGPLTDPAAHGGDRGDAFHVVIPSLPGFGLSDKPTTTGWGINRIAGAWTTLMERLGYSTWAAQGGDWGAAVTTMLGYQPPAALVGSHLNLVLYQPSPEEIAQARPEERAMLAGARRYNDQLSGYAKVQGTRPQTIGYSLADSPVGLAAWIYTLFQDVSDNDGDAEAALSRDEMLDDISMFPREQVHVSRRWAERRFSDLVHFNELDRGGHFAALEQPDLFTNEVRA